MDLDRFKEVNDTLGHDCGDALLHELGERLQSRMRSVDTVARLGGDEFGFLLSDVDFLEASELVARIQRALHDPFTLQELPVHVEASIGIALFPDHGETVDLLLQRADVAMYVAKRCGQRLRVLRRAQGRPHADASDARSAICARHSSGASWSSTTSRRSSSRPAASAASRRCCAGSTRRAGLLQPDDFMPVAERSGLMDRLTRYVIDEALRHQQMWRRAGRELPVAVNVSMLNLLDPAFPDDVLALLDRWGAPASSLSLEITEHTVVADRVRVEEVLSWLADCGLKIAIDDFGTGYSSLALLRRLPLHGHQDRPLVRPGDDERPRRRGDRPLDDRARAQPRAEGDRRGRRHRRDLRRARAARLRRGAGFPPGRGAPCARDRAVARGSGSRHSPASCPARPTAASGALHHRP